MKRELKLAEREVEHLSNSPANILVQQPPSHIKVKTIRELISDFDGGDTDFQQWKERFQLLCTTWDLDEANGRLLMSLKLKGKAQKWLQSISEFIGITLQNLLAELSSMFDHRQNKLDLRKKFEHRKWKNFESFNKYFHETIILANAASIDEEDILTRNVP